MKKLLFVLIGCISISPLGAFAGSEKEGLLEGEQKKAKAVKVPLFFNKKLKGKLQNLVDDQISKIASGGSDSIIYLYNNTGHTLDKVSLDAYKETKWDPFGEDEFNQDIYDRLVIKDIINDDGVVFTSEQAKLGSDNPASRIWITTLKRFHFDPIKLNLGYDENANSGKILVFNFKKEKADIFKVRYHKNATGQWRWEMFPVQLKRDRTGTTIND